MEVCNVKKRIIKLMNVLLIMTFVVAMSACTTTQKPMPQQQGLPDIAQQLPDMTQQQYQNPYLNNMPQGDTDFTRLL